MNCQKMRYQSRADAKRHARGTDYGHNARKQPPPNAYYCKRCDAWHLSSLSKAEARRRGYRR